MNKLTIGMPVFNDAPFLKHAIESLLNQTYKDFLLILSDDGSSDGSQQICEEFAQLDSRIHYIRQTTNLGISKNMEFLLSQANTEFFMWAADDDIWDKDFIKLIIDKLIHDKDAASSFGTFIRVDEKGYPISDPLDFDYSGKSARIRLEKLIENPNDSFGYGIFRTSKIKEVRFPIWWWPNKKDPYNNIYPALCYFLCQGNYLHCYSRPLFFNRFKTPQNINHKTPYNVVSLRGTMAFSLRKFNLITYSTKLIRKSSGVNFALSFYPSLFQHWFLKPMFLQWKHYLKTIISKP